MNLEEDGVSFLLHRRLENWKNYVPREDIQSFFWYESWKKLFGIIDSSLLKNSAVVYLKPQSWKSFG